MDEFAKAALQQAPLLTIGTAGTLSVVYLFLKHLRFEKESFRSLEENSQTFQTHILGEHQRLVESTSEVLCRNSALLEENIRMLGSVQETIRNRG